MAAPVLIKNRYEIKDVLGRGGMGVVYKAFDALMRREVAVKTLRDVASSVFVDLFYRECSVLTAMVHPNIVEIFDMGEFEEDGVLKPYFVMPLLPGRTLYDLIYPSGRPLAVERCIDIISQACRGLHAAHECGLLHRDIKPRNIFVMRDDAVKLIDFGVVRLLGHQTIGAPGTLGTLHYMAPEQISMKPLTARSDIFSLATVCYEALTGVHPFVRENETETAAAVAEHTPALISSLNPLVNRPLAQAVAQAMAKDQRNRFESAAAFADALQRGLRNERPGASLLTNPQNRLARAQRSFARGDYEFTQEIVEQLEAEGADGPEVQELRSQLAEAVRKQQSEVQLATARRYFEEDEHVLALRRVTEVLETNPSHAAARQLKNQIEDKLNALHIADSLARATAHLDTGAFTEARRLIEDSLEIQPDNAEANRLLREADQRAREWPKQRQQQEELFQTAQSAYFEGRFETSLRTLEQLAELTRKSKAAGARVTEYKDFYKRVRADYDALQAMLSDARKLLANGDLDSAFALSERLKEQCPQDPDVRTLSKDIAGKRDAKEQDYRRGIARSIANEPDLSARLHILNQAVRSRPTDEYFHEERQKLQALLQKITELVQRAQVYEASGRYEYAIEEWLCVGDTYPAYPGLQDQLTRIKEIWTGVRDRAKAELRVSVLAALRQGDQDGAAGLLRAAAADFRDDPDYEQLKAQFDDTAAAYTEVNVLLERIQKAESERRFGDIPTLCQIVAAVSENIDPLRTRVQNVLTEIAARLVSGNWRVAEQVSQEAARLGARPSGVQEHIRQQQREEEVSGILSEERGAQTDLNAYRTRVAALLEKYPDEPRLEERLRLIDAALADKRRLDEKKSCAAELALMRQELCDANDHRRLWDTYIRAKTMAAPFVDDREIADLLEAIREQGSRFEEAADALTRDRIKDCYGICDSMLRKYPGHVLYQKLRDQAGARHRQLGEEYLARVERWLASEPDVYQRELILRKAQEEYPFETRYGEELNLIQREKAVAETMAAKARDLEKRGQTAEALGQWRQLRNLHPTFPQLEENIGRCEGILERAQRKIRAQRLLAQGEEHLAEGHFAQGYQMVHEASQTSAEIPELLRQTAPNLVAASRSALPSNPKLAEALVNLAQELDDALRLPKDMRAKINEARRAEDLLECLRGIETHQEAGDLDGALGLAERFLGRYPGARQVEAARTRLLGDLELEHKQQLRLRTLDQFRQMELSAVAMPPEPLQQLKQRVHEAAQDLPGDEEVRQRAVTLGALFTLLAEVRTHLQKGALTQAEEACARAFEQFPAHPLFKAALTEAAKQQSQAAAQNIEDVKQRVAAESDFDKQAALLDRALDQFPEDSSLLEEMAAVKMHQAALRSRIDEAQAFETKRLFGEAIREWEGIGKDYPWLTSAAAEIERISNARRKDKHDSLDRWFRQVEDAIGNGDYDTAGTMIRQAAQQQPDRKLQSLEEKLKDALKRKQESDAKLAEGKGLLADGDLLEGGNALYRAYELQPKDKEKANAIALLLLGQIRANLATDMASCESLLGHLNRIRPSETLPPDIKDAVAKKQQAKNAIVANSSRRMAQLEVLVSQAEKARSKRALSSVNKKLQESHLLDSRDVDVRRTAGELQRNINLRLSGFDPAAKAVRQEPLETGRRFSAGSVVAAAILLLCVAGVIFFLSRPHSHHVVGVPVVISVTPERTTVELEGMNCVSPECQFTLTPGEHVAKLSKQGYQPKDIVIPVKENDGTVLNVAAALDPIPVAEVKPVAPAPPPKPLQTAAATAKIEIHGAFPHTEVRLDGVKIGEVAFDGTFRTAVPPGPHTLDLSLEGFSKRTITRNFDRGELILAKEDVQLERRPIEIQR